MHKIFHPVRFPIQKYSKRNFLFFFNLQVIPVSKRNEPLLDDYSWRYLKHQLAPFAIQTGVFDCALDRE